MSIPTYLVEFVSLAPRDAGWSMRATTITPSRHFPVGSDIRTSVLKSIDFERGIAVTQNSVYMFKPTGAL